MEVSADAETMLSLLSTVVDVVPAVVHPERSHWEKRLRGVMLDSGTCGVPPSGSRQCA